jgi:hypothetical protein
VASAVLLIAANIPDERLASTPLAILPQGDRVVGDPQPESSIIDDLHKPRTIESAVHIPAPEESARLVSNLTPVVRQARGVRLLRVRKQDSAGQQCRHARLTNVREKLATLELLCLWVEHYSSCPTNLSDI